MRDERVEMRDKGGGVRGVTEWIWVGSIHCVPSSLHRNSKLALLFFRILHSYIKFVFSYARVPKMP